MTKKKKLNEQERSLAKAQGMAEEDPLWKAAEVESATWKGIMPKSVTKEPDFFERANSFELKGGSMKIQFDSISFEGPPQFYYVAESVQHFKGSEIRQLDTEIGRLVTVTIDKVHGTTLTILIPNFRKETSFTTWAIFTTHKSGLDEPDLSWGSLPSYSVDQLTGTAQKKIF